MLILAVSELTFCDFNLLFELFDLIDACLGDLIDISSMLFFELCLLQEQLLHSAVFVDNLFT